MGQVWLAEQVTPVRRQAALKLIRAGICDDTTLLRFRRVYMLVRGADPAESMSRYLIQRIYGNASIELLYNSELTDLRARTASKR
jgi:hypothetical protein